MDNKPQSMFKKFIVDKWEQSLRKSINGLPPTVGIVDINGVWGRGVGRTLLLNSGDAPENKMRDDTVSLQEKIGSIRKAEKEVTWIQRGWKVTFQTVDGLYVIKTRNLDHVITVFHTRSRSGIRQKIREIETDIIISEVSSL